MNKCIRSAIIQNYVDNGEAEKINKISSNKRREIDFGLKFSDADLEIDCSIA